MFFFHHQPSSVPPVFACLPRFSPTDGRLLSLSLALSRASSPPPPSPPFPPPFHHQQHVEPSPRQRRLMWQVAALAELGERARERERAGPSHESERDSNEERTLHFSSLAFLLLHASPYAFFFFFASRVFSAISPQIILPFLSFGFFFSPHVALMLKNGAAAEAAAATAAAVSSLDRLSMRNL